MKKNLIFPLVVSSLFIPSIEAIERTTDLNSLENENNIYEAVDILIAEGGGGMTMEEKRKKKERQKKAQEIRKRQKVINEKGYFPYWADIREKVLKEKTKINNDPIGNGDFFKLLDEKMAKLKFIEIMLNLIDECQLYQTTDLAQENGMPESLRKARTSFINEIKKVYSLFSEEFQNEISNLDFYVSFGFAIMKDDSSD